MSAQDWTPEPWRPSDRAGDAIVAGEPPERCVACEAAAEARWPGALCEAHEWKPNTPIGDRTDEHSRRSYGGILVAESMSEADRRRVIACVNYCQGVPTDVLERRIAERRTDEPYGFKSLRLIREAAKRGMRLAADGTLILQTGKPAEAEPDEDGYRSLNLSVDGVRCKVTVARVVCFLAHGEPPHPQCVADHIDGNILNDHPSNLRWATYSANARNSKESRDRKGVRTP